MKTIAKFWDDHKVGIVCTAIFVTGCCVGYKMGINIACHNITSGLNDVMLRHPDILLREVPEVISKEMS